jgi:hypothetical protein
MPDVRLPNGVLEEIKDIESYTTEELRGLALDLAAHIRLQDRIIDAHVMAHKTLVEDIKRMKDKVLELLGRGIERTQGVEL